MSQRLPAPVRAVHRVLRRVVEDERVGVLERMAGQVVRPTAVSGGTRRALRGDWLGHAAHPMLTDFTDGPWMAASFLDLFGPPGSAAAARRLVGFGLLASVPTMLSGLQDWTDTRGRDRRIGLVHAATSSLATALYAASYVARRRDRHRGGVALGVLGGVVAFVDGYVGGELSLIARAGTGRRTLAGAAEGP